MFGDAAPARAKPRKTSRGLRWGIKLLFLALSLMLTRGLLQAPEVRAMLQDGVTAVQGFIAEERARVEASATAAVAATLQRDTAPAPPPERFADRVTVRRNLASAAPQLLTGPVEQVLAGNALLLDGTPVVLAGLSCAAPESDAGRKARRGLQQITRGQTLRCSVGAAAGPHAVRASCSLKDGRDLALAMRADGLCQPG